MNHSQQRLTLQIDIFEQRQQEALVLPTASGADLIQAILAEFKEVEYLSSTAVHYQLQRATGMPELVVNPEALIGEQLTNGERLTLMEVEAPLPAQTHRPTHALYLREPATGQVHKLHWLPAIIGRADEKLPNHEQLALDLTIHPAGLRVSRRHAVITEEAGRYYIADLAPNPLAIHDSQGETAILTNERHPLRHGDTVHLVRSDIRLTFLLRTPSTVAAEMGEQGKAV